MSMPKAERKRRSERAKAMAARLRAEGKWTNGNPKRRPRSADELALLYAEVAARTGRTEGAVRAMRNRRRSNAGK
jgi:hypothetical protein